MTYSQYGEDDIVASRFVGDYGGIAVEVGAGDGLHLSNTALFRLRGWLTVLIEPDPQYRAALGALQRDNNNVSVRVEAATPENINDLVPPDTALLSIDVDGDDIFLFEALEHTPSIVIIEYNPTMPQGEDVQPARLGLKVGASVTALNRVAQEKGYGLYAVTPCNVIFEYGYPGKDIAWTQPAYTVATEYFTGRPFVVGTAPWGVDFGNPYPADDVIIGHSVR